MVQKLTERKGDLVDMRPSGSGRTRLRFYVPTRSLIGYQPELLSDTRGTAIFNRLFHEYQPYKGALPGRRTGVLISNSNGVSVAFALWNLEDRGPMMIDAGVEVYEGMIVGEHTRDNDLEVNPVKGKQLTNIRTHSKDEAVKLTTPKKLTLEQSLGYIADDEYVEVTPKSHPPAQDLARPQRAQEAVPRGEGCYRLSVQAASAARLAGNARQPLDIPRPIGAGHDLSASRHAVLCAPDRLVGVSHHDHHELADQLQCDQHPQRVVATIWRILNQITEPILRPIRRIVPSMGGLDLSPIVVFVVIFFFQQWIDHILRTGSVL